MTKYTTRVELYGNPDYKTYEILHAKMLQAGFTRQVEISKVTYWLPNAEYTFYGEATTVIHVKDNAVKIAGLVWKDFGVLVTKTEVDRGFHNLKKVG